MAFWNKIKGHVAHAGRNLAESAVWDALYKGVIELVKTFATETGTHVATNVVPTLIVSQFGLKTEDERRVLDQMEQMQQQDRIRLNKKLGAIPRSRSNYYRMTILNEDPTRTLAILTMHARMDPKEWRNHVKSMDYDVSQAYKTWGVIWAWVKTDGREALRKFWNGLDDLLADTLNAAANSLRRLERRGRRANFGIETSWRSRGNPRNLIFSWGNLMAAAAILVILGFLIYAN